MQNHSLTFDLTSKFEITKLRSKYQFHILLAFMFGCCQPQITSNSRELPNSRFEVGDYIVYGFNGSAFTIPVQLHREVIANVNDSIVFRNILVRGTEQLAWQNSFFEPSKIANGVNYNNSHLLPTGLAEKDISRLDSWGLLLKIEQHHEVSFFEKSTAIENTKYQCKEKAGTAVERSTSIHFSFLYCPDFLWSHGPAKVVEEKENVLWQRKILASGRAFGNDGALLGDSALEAAGRVPANPDGGFNWPYYLIMPKNLKHPNILVTPNNTGSGKSDDVWLHENAAKLKMYRNRNIAEEVGVPLLMPTFPRPQTNWKMYTHALDRDTILTEVESLIRIDLQLIAMVEDARVRLKRLGIDTESEIILAGFSAGGMFANRFSMIHPDRVKAVALGSPGGWPIAPALEYLGKQLRYPIGVADFEDLFGAPFNVEKFKSVPCWVFMGDKDANDSVDYEDSFPLSDKLVIDTLFGETPISRWSTSKKLYKRAGSNCEFRLYKNIAHTVSKKMSRDIVNFFNRILSSK